MPTFKDLTGKKFGRLSVISRYGHSYKKDKIGRITWLCKCECGKEKVIVGEKLSSGRTRSCGCICSPLEKEAIEKTRKKIKRFTYINQKNGCWEWQKYKNKLGYGQICYMGKQLKAHRVSWIVFKGPIPDGMCVLHKCDNPRCINPVHLFLGSMKDNVQDMINKGRHDYGMPIGIKAWHAKLTDEDVLWIRQQEYSWKKCEEIAEKFGMSAFTIYNVFKRKTWKHLHDPE